MSLMINTNIESLNAQNNLERTEASIATSMQHLSSGLRVNIAGDDVAAYGIGQRIQGQLNGINQAHQNTQDAVSLTQTAQGALNTVQQILQRVRTLAVENANGTLSKEDKEAVKKAAEELTTELKRIGETTTFNEVKLLASEEEIKFQVGGNEKESIGVKTTKLEEAIKGVKVEEIKTVDEAINKVSKAAAEFGSIQNRLQYTLTNQTIFSQNLEAAHSSVVDANMAAEMAAFTKEQVLQQAGVSVLAQANALPQAVLKLLG